MLVGRGVVMGLLLGLGKVHMELLGISSCCHSNIILGLLVCCFAGTLPLRYLALLSLLVRSLFRPCQFLLMLVGWLQLRFRLLEFNEVEVARRDTHWGWWFWTW